MSNLFVNLPVETKDEVFTELLSRPGARIERIVSNGQSTPEDTPFNCRTTTSGFSIARFCQFMGDGDGEHDLHPGDHMLIPLVAPIG